MGFSKDPPAGDTYTKGTNTYGWGGSEPSTDKNTGYGVSNPADGVKTGEASAGAPLWDNIDGTEKPYTDNIAGQSPVSGLMHGSDVCNSDWEDTSVMGAEISYVGNNASTGSGASGTLGAWPIKGAALNPALSHVNPDRPSDGSWNDSATPGSESSSWKGKGSGGDSY